MRPTWVLLVAVLILASSAETLAAPLVVEQGFYQTTAFAQTGTFSGVDFAVSLNIGGGFFSTPSFNTGTFHVAFGTGAGALSGPGTIQVDGVSCGTLFLPGAPDCRGDLTFIYQPNLLPTFNTTGEAPFTMTGQLIVGQSNLPNVTVDIEGSGIVHATNAAGLESNARFDFVPEPSTVALVLSGLVAVGWGRWRAGKQAGSSRSTAAAD